MRGPFGILFLKNFVKFSLCIGNEKMFENFRTDLRTNVLLMLVMVIFTSDCGIHSRIFGRNNERSASHYRYSDAYYGIPFAKPPIGNLHFEIKSGPEGLSLIEAVRKYEGLKYVYRFDYQYVVGYYTAGKFLGRRFLGATHADEMPILFKQNFTGVAEEDLAFGDEMITRWVNFAYSGNPNSPFPLDTNVFGAWDPVSSPRIEFLRIDRNGDMEKDYFEEEYGIWRRLPMFSKYSSN